MKISQNCGHIYLINLLITEEKQLINYKQILLPDIFEGLAVNALLFNKEKAKTCQVREIFFN